MRRYQRPFRKCSVNTEWHGTQTWQRPASVDRLACDGRRAVGRALGRLRALLERAQVRLDPATRATPGRAGRGCPVQRSNGSNVAAWITRVPPATGSSRQLHSLSNPEPRDPQPEERLRPGLEALDPGVLAQQPEACARGPGRGRGRPRRGGRTEPQLREQARLSGRVVQRRPDDPRRGLDEDASLDEAGRRGDGRRVAGSRPPGRGGPPSSDPDRVPDRLHLEEGGDPFGPLGGAVVEPVERASVTVVGRRRRRLMSSAASELGVASASSSGTPHVSIASTSSWAARTGTSSGLQPGQHVDDAAGHVGRGEDLGQRDRRQRPRLGREERRPRCPATSGGASRQTSPSSDEVSGATTPDDAGRLGDREVEVRRRDRVGRAEHLGDLVGPAGVPDPAVDGPVDDARAAFASRSPSAAATSATNWSRRPSISSATR